MAAARSSSDKGRTAHRIRLSRRALALLAGTGLAGAALAGCGSAASEAGGGVLTVAPNVSGPFVSTFNPFLPTSNTASGSVDNVIYEPLYMPDQTTDTYQPWLSTAYAWSSGGKTLTLTIRKGVRWSDGTPLTASDVAYTFNLEKDNAALNTGDLPIAGATAPNPTTAVLTFTAPAYSYLDPILTAKPVPEHVWQHVKDPATFADQHPVGSGPYLLGTFTPQAITLTKNPRFWQAGKVKVQTMRYLAFDSASSIQSAMESGQIDLEDHVFTDFKTIVARPGIGGLLTNIGSEELIFNVSRYPLNILAVRQAINDAIDRQALSAQGLNGLQAPITSPTGLPPVLAKDLAPAYKGLSYGAANPAKSRALLTAAGFKPGPNGIFVTPKGTPLNLTIIQGTGQTNLPALAQVLKQQLQAAGIGLTIQTEEFPAVNSSVMQGNFSVYIDQDTAFTPFDYYRLLMDPKDYKPAGQRAAYDLGRFEDPAARAPFAAWAVSAPGSPAAESAMDTIESIMVNQLPAIPLCATAPQGAYNTKQFTGWPTQSALYGLPEVIGDDAEVLMLHVRPVG